MKDRLIKVLGLVMALGLIVLHAVVVVFGGGDRA